jgi:hypothetical protein
MGLVPDGARKWASDGFSRIFFPEFRVSQAGIVFDVLKNIFGAPDFHFLSMTFTIKAL